MKKAKHGANIFQLSKDLGVKIEDFMDFSSNINPFGASKKAINSLKDNIEKANMYPDPNYSDLKNSILNYLSKDGKLTVNEDDLLIGLGASSFISFYIENLNVKRGMLIVPAYSEYENELNKVGVEIFKYYLKEEEDFKINIEKLNESILKNNIDFLVLCNPNNPTGTEIENSLIKEILVKNKNLRVMVDETYVEFSNTKIYSTVNLFKDDSQFLNRLYTIRGTSKFFASPGIRLGYSICKNNKIKEIYKKTFTLWEINIFASIMGENMFNDFEYIDYVYNNIQKEKEYIRCELKKIHKLKVFDTKSNFMMIKIKDEYFSNDKYNCEELYKYLLTKNMIIRDLSSFETLDTRFFRISVCKHEANEQLVREIKEFFK